jgi:cell division protein FtsZ
MTGAMPELRPRITVIGVGGAGGNAVNNMIRSHLEGVEFAVANTDAQALTQSNADKRIQLGITVTQGLGAGSRPDIGRIAAEEALEDIIDDLRGSNMAFIAAGMGGGTGTGAAPVIARAAREQGILTVGVVTKPFQFEGAHRMRIAEAGIEELEQYVDTLIIIPNQNLFRVANEKTTFSDAFKMADDVLHSGVRGVTDLMVMPGLINLDFADIRAVMSEMGKAMMGTGEASGERRALDAAEAAISNPLLDDISMKGARGMLINITGGPDMTLFEVDEAANRVRSEVDPDAYIIFGSTFDDSMDGLMRVSVVATGMDASTAAHPIPATLNLLGAVGGTTTSQSTVPADAAVAADDDPASEGVEMEDAVGPDKAAAFQVTAADGSDNREDKQTPELPAAAARTSAPPLADTPDVFIPPLPVTRSGVEMRSAPDPFKDAAMKNGSRPSEGETVRAKPRVSSLFARVTGAGRLSRATKPEAGSEPVEERPVAPPKQQRLGGLNPEERLPASQPEEEVLDIPAFLRRQAN